MQDEKEFRDKLSAIYVALNFSLDPQAASDKHGLRPILNYQTTELIEQKVHVTMPITDHRSEKSSEPVMLMFTQLTPLLLPLNTKTKPCSHGLVCLFVGKKTCPNSAQLRILV